MIAGKNIMEVLVVDIGDHSIGMDCEEVKRVITLEDDAKKKELMKGFKENKTFFNLAEIMKENLKEECSSFILTKMKNGTEILISVPYISDILNPEISEILVAPEYLRKRQNPFFVWGFLPNDGAMIRLVTFSFFNGE
jgi:chemotaxis signal transduction protein